MTPRQRSSDRSHLMVSFRDRAAGRRRRGRGRGGRAAQAANGGVGVHALGAVQGRLAREDGVRAAGGQVAVLAVVVVLRRVRVAVEADRRDDRRRDLRARGRAVSARAAQWCPACALFCVSQRPADQACLQRFRHPACTQRPRPQRLHSRRCGGGTHASPPRRQHPAAARERAQALCAFASPRPAREQRFRPC